MSSLRVISLTVLAESIYNILIFFAEKMWVAFALQKLLTFFQQKISAYLRRRYLLTTGPRLIFILFLHVNICCGYSLEAPRQGTSNEYHSICFHGEIRKLSIIFYWKMRLNKSYGCKSIQSDQSLCCWHEETLHPWLSKNASVQYSDQNVKMHRLIWIFAGCTCPKVHFLMLQLTRYGKNQRSWLHSMDRLAGFSQAHIVFTLSIGTP